MAFVSEVLALNVKLTPSTSPTSLKPNPVWDTLKSVWDGSLFISVMKLFIIWAFVYKTGAPPKTSPPLPIYVVPFIVTLNMSVYVATPAKAISEIWTVPSFIFLIAFKKSGEDVSPKTIEPVLSL